MKKAIAVLTRGYNQIQSYNMLIRRNEYIEKNIKNKLYHLLIFHEGNISRSHQQYIQACSNLPIKFIGIPPFTPIKDVNFTLKSGGHGWGYRHMCSFWFVDFWEYVEDYDMILRIDEDCIMESNLDLIFKELEDKVCVYGKWHPDDESVTEGLNDFSLKFFGNEKGPKEPSGPYTNVLGLNLRLLRKNNKLFEYINKLKQSNNIFIHRWGDLPLWGEILYYMYKPSEYQENKKIKYYHISHNQYVNK